MAMYPHMMLSLGAISLLAVVALFLLLRNQGNAGKWSLVFALLITATGELLDTLILYSPSALSQFKPYVFVCEALLPLGWALYAYSLVDRSLWQISWPNGLLWGSVLLLLATAIGAGTNAMVFSPDFGRETILFLGQIGFAFYLLLTFTLIGVLVLFERTFARLSRRDRWALKFELLGIGAIVAMQLLYFSQGALYRTLDMSLLPIRWSAIIIGLLLFLYARLTRRRPARLQLSHAAAFRSVVLLVVSLYLIVLGVAGEGLRYLDPESNRSMLIILALVGGVALCILVLSESLRRKTRVFLHKHFLRQKYDYRALWLEMTRQLGSARSPDALHTAILEMYCRTFSLHGALYLKDDCGSGFDLVIADDGFKLPSRFNPGKELQQLLCQKGWVLDLDASAEDIAAEAAEPLARSGVRFVVPLPFDHALGGAILLSRPVNADESLSYEDYDLMKIFARQAAAVLFNEQLSQQLVDQREMAAVGRISAFVMHDLKNLVSNLSLLVGNARELIGDQRFQIDMLATLDNTVDRMNGLIGRLKSVGPTAPLSLEACNLKQLVHETVAGLGSNDIAVSGDDIEVVVDRGEIGKVITNLVLNSLEASDERRKIQLEIDGNPEPQLVCRDEGCGMPAEFIAANLFRPFTSTKKKGLGIGLYQCRQIVEAHGGHIEVASVVGRGSEFRIHLPPAGVNGVRGVHG